MNDTSHSNLDYMRPVKISEGIYWVGSYDINTSLHCNPYIIIEGDEAVVIDGGSRLDFPTVMMKILQTGLDPSSIKALIYQHYDPDECSGIPNFEDIINRKDLKLISDRINNIFIKHYYVSSPLHSLEDVNYSFTFSSGRKLKFVKTPHAHSAGSFVTLDTKTGVLFTSDLFGNYAAEWNLFLKLDPECSTCLDYTSCPISRSYCPLEDILKFHKNIMPSERILRWSLEQIAKLPFSVIAPQHGSVIYRPQDIVLVCERLVSLRGVGIDGISENRSYSEFGDIAHLKKRLAMQ